MADETDTSHEVAVLDQPAPETARVRLRAFEDEVLGKDAVRINGHIERGHGSMFGRLTPEQKAYHVALEHLVKTEEKLARTAAELASAEVDHASAVKAAELASVHADEGTDDDPE